MSHKTKQEMLSNAVVVVVTVGVGSNVDNEDISFRSIFCIARLVSSGFPHSRYMTRID